MARNDGRQPLPPLSIAIVDGYVVRRYPGDRLTFEGTDGVPIDDATRQRLTQKYWRIMGVRGNDPDDDRQSER